MGDGFVRSMTFRSRNLGRDSTFLLTFDEGIPGLYNTVFPTALRVTAFGASGPYDFPVTYVQRLGITKAGVSGGVVVPASTYTEIDPGEKTTLTKSGDPAIYRFSNPESIQPPGKQIVATNGTNGLESLGVGFFERTDRAPAHMLVFENVGAGSSAQFEFTPILKGYMITGYREGAVLRAQITSPVIFREYLVNLPPNSDWLVTYNPGSGVYNIERDLSRS